MPERRVVHLIDLSHESEIGLGSDAMPLQLGLIGAYCKDRLGDHFDIEIFKFIEDFERAVKERPPAVVGVSNYIWNIELGYRTVEVPVTKVYPPKALGQTKMPPVTGWWSMLRPLVYLGLGLKR